MEEKKETRSFIKELHPIAEMMLFAGILQNAFGSIKSTTYTFMLQYFNDFGYLEIIGTGLNVLMIVALIMILISKKQGLYLFFYTEIASVFTAVGLSGGYRYAYHTNHSSVNTNNHSLTFIVVKRKWKEWLLDIGTIQITSQPLVTSFSSGS